MPRYVELRTCHRKFPHPSLESAEQEAARLREAGFDHQTAYHCIFCSLWHVGKSRTGRSHVEKWMFGLAEQA